AAQVLGKAVRRELVRLAVDPHRALAIDRRVVDPGDQVPGHRAPVPRLADSGAPLPTRVPGIVRGGVVNDRAGVHGKPAPVDPHRPDRPDPSLLTRPPVAAAGGADG